MRRSAGLIQKRDLFPWRGYKRESYYHFIPGSKIFAAKQDTNKENLLLVSCTYNNKMIIRYG